jgi:hypothetical protein
MNRQVFLLQYDSVFSPLWQLASRLVCFAIVISLASAASAALIVYEPFDYPANQRVLGQTNPSNGNTWLRAATATDTTAINTAAGSLTTPYGLAQAAGNSAKITGVGNSSGAANRLGLGTGFTTNVAATVYYSLLLRVDDVSNSNNVLGGFFIGLNDTGNVATTNNPTSVAARIQIRQDPTDISKYNLGIIRQRAPAGTGADVDWTGPMTPGKTLFLVASTELVPGLQNDISRLWINPDRSTYGDEMPPDATITDDSTGVGTDIGVASIILRQSPAPFLTLDELRVGTTWGDVVPLPEPGTFGLLMLGAIGLLTRRLRNV